MVLSHKHISCPTQSPLFSILFLDLHDDLNQQGRGMCRGKKQLFVSIRCLENCIFIFTFMPFQPDRQTDGQNIYRIDVHLQEECAQKKMKVYLNQEPIKSRFPLNVVDGYMDIRTDRRKDGRTFEFIEQLGYKKYIKERNLHYHHYNKLPLLDWAQLCLHTFNLKFIFNSTCQNCLIDFKLGIMFPFNGSLDA